MFFQCGLLGDDSQQYFTIHPTTDGNHYAIEWCHTFGDYTDAHCDTENSTQAVYGNTIAAVSAEELIACATHIHGIVGDQQTVGNSSDFVQGRGSSGTWMARTFSRTFDGANCDSDPPTNKFYNWHQDHNGSGDSTIMHFYDTRNSF